MNNRYTKLASNTLILAVGQFGSKFLVYLMMRFYTDRLSDTGYGAVSNIVNASTLSMTLVTLGIGEAVIRFGLDARYDKKQVFKIGFFVTLAGVLSFAFLSPLLGLVGFLKAYVPLLFLYVCTGSVKSVCALFVRSSGHVKLFAVDGIVTTFTNVLLNLFLLDVAEKWWFTRTGETGGSVYGYVLSVVLADFVSICFLTVSAKLWRNFKPVKLDKTLLRKMLKFSLPMVPTAIMWWVTGVSDGFLVTAFIGVASNGIYMAAYKLPNIIALVSGIFSQAWNMSAVEQRGSKTLSEFYTRVFDIFQSVIFLMGGGLMLLIRPALSVMATSEFAMAFWYTPFLILSVMFTCFGQFCGSVYVAEKKSGRSMLTASAGAALNLLLNIILIPRVGMQGAAFATFISYLAVFFIRVKDAGKIVRVRVNKHKFVTNLMVTADMAFVVLTGMARSDEFFYGSLLVLFVLLTAANLDSAAGILSLLRRKKQV